VKVLGVAAERIKARIPGPAKRQILDRRIRWRSQTARFRVLPDFLIIGTQRGGTSSLSSYLAQHPSVVRSLRKETEYFSRRYGLGIDWYRAHFPLRFRKVSGPWSGDGLLTFEATPDYIFYPHAPERARRTIPHAKLIVLLRNPVDRAISHHRHMVRLGFETLPFEEAIAAEAERIAADVAALRRDPLHQPRALLRFSYISRGLYAEQLERWMQAFPRERFLIVKSEDFFADPASVFDQVIAFLGLRPWRPRSFANVTHRRRPPGPQVPAIPLDVRVRLGELFAPHNARLYESLGRDFGWDDPRRGSP